MLSQKLTRNIVLVFFPFILFAQESFNSSGEYSLEVERNRTLGQTIEECIEKAKIDAIEKKFGRIVFQGNSTYVENIETGKKVESKQVFNSIGTSHTNGEWVKTTSSDTLYYPGEKKGEQWVKIKIAGLIRALPEVKINYEVFTLSASDEKFKTTNFNDGQELFVMITPTENGYMVVYLDDPQFKETFKIIPSNETNFEVVQKRKQSFFPKKDDPNRIVFKLNKENKSEQYKLFVLFSINPIEVPILTNFKNEDKFIEEKIKTGNYALPQSMESEKFQIWLQELRSRNKNIQLEILPCFLN